jgi:hypothetical protein
MLYLLYLFLLLKQVCMFEQWLALDLLRSVSNPLGVIYFTLLHKSERTFVGLILKFKWDLVFVL